MEEGVRGFGLRNGVECKCEALAQEDSARRLS